MNERSAAAYIGTPGADPGRANELIHNIVDSESQIGTRRSCFFFPNTDVCAKFSDTPSELTLETQLRVGMFSQK